MLLATLAPSFSGNWLLDGIHAIPRIICGLLLTIDFGSPKFGLPWTDPERNLKLFQVPEWFVSDVSEFGFPFSFAPGFFAWMAAAAEGLGGLLLALGLATRTSAFFIVCTMLVAIFYQKWGDVLQQGAWPILPALSFLWVALYSMSLGSGRFGADYWIHKGLRKD